VSRCEATLAAAVSRKRP